MGTENKSYIGGGKLHLDGRFVGNVPALNLTFESETIELQDYTSPGGGLYNSLERISSVGFSFDFNDYSAENLAVALFGSYTNVPGGAQADESHSVPATLDTDLLIKTNFTIDTADVAGTVTVTSDPAGTTYTLDTDYTVSAAGITVIAGGAIVASAPLLISYTAIEVDLVQALVSSGQEYDMVFDGFNDAQSGTPVVVHIFKGKPSPAEGLPLISDEFAANTVNGTITKDATKTAQGISQYFTVAVA